MVHELTFLHCIYVTVILTVIGLMIAKRDVVIVCLVGLLLVAGIYTGSLIGGLQTLFNGLLVAGKELFDIMLVISVMVAMLKALHEMGADYKMFSPLRKLIRSPMQAYFVLGLAAFASAAFFWPTPATALVGPLLIPVCISVGLPAIAAAMAFNILGHGMALSGDLVIQGALKLSSTAAGVTVDAMFFKAAILSFTCGAVASIVGYIMVRKDIAEFGRSGKLSDAQADSAAEPEYMHPQAGLFALLVPLAFFAAAGCMVVFKIRGGDATALIGGLAVLVLVIATVVCDRGNCFDKSVTYIREGFLFGIKIFAPVIPIAAFFFLGGPPSEEILGAGAPQLLFDIGHWVAAHLPLGRVSLVFGDMMIGMIAGLEGSGFVGLPLTGSLAAAFGGSAGLDVSWIAAAGQMGSIWTGGGTLVPWAFGLAATAGIANVNPVELARRNFIPVLCGLCAAALVAIMMM